VAIAGTVLGAVFTGSLTATPWTHAQGVAFDHAVTIGGSVLTVLAGVLVVWAMVRAGRARAGEPSPAAEGVASEGLPEGLPERHQPAGR
jgi:hypothetical protein